MKASIFLVLIATSMLQVQSMEHENRYVGAFFYPSYGKYRCWNVSGLNPPLTWASHYLPDLKPVGFNPPLQLYSSDSEEIIELQISLMKRAGLDFVIASWWGPGSYEDVVLQKIFEVASGDPDPSSPKWCIIYEKESGNPSVSEILEDLKYIEETYGWSNVYFRLDGRLVLFVMAGSDDGVAYAEKWGMIRNEACSFYTLLKVFPGFIRVRDYADSWFQYAPANRFEVHEGFSAYVSPGFWRWDEEPRLERDPSEFAKALMRLYYAPAQFLLIETWNNWLEGNQIEPAYQVTTRGDRYVQSSISYGTTYIDLVRKMLSGEGRLVMPGPHLIVGTVSSLLAGALIIMSMAEVLRGGRGGKSSIPA